MPASKGDHFKALDEAYAPDPRNSSIGITDISVMHAAILPYQLDDGVPEDIVTQYEVARNIYLYAFHTYRFFMAAQHQVLVVLEYAIKSRFGRREIAKYGKKVKKGQNLPACLKYIIDKGYIENEDFPAWKDHQKNSAEFAYQMEKIDEMQREGLSEIMLDYSEIDYESYDTDYDYLEVLARVIPLFRNEHAHGSSMLYNNVLTTFENVSIIINKIYQPSAI